MPEGWGPGSTEGVYAITMKQMLTGVKDSNGKPFFRLANRNDNIKVVMLNFIVFSIGCSCPEFPDN